MKNKMFMSVISAACLLLSSCSRDTAAAEKTAVSVSPEIVVSGADFFTGSDHDTSYGDCTRIVLSDGGCTVSGSGAAAEGSIVTITSEGTYLFRGTLSDGSIVVDAKNKKIRLVLDNASVTAKTGAALHVKNAEKVFVTTEDGSVNSLVSAGDGEKPDGALYSKPGLTLNGGGTLKINSVSENGIVCKNELKITGGDYVITAAKKGISCKESFGTAGGSITLNCTDDAINTGEAVYILGGSITASSDDDGIHADGDIIVSGGSVNITRSCEGIEGRTVTIAGGDVAVTAENDGVNAKGDGLEKTDENARITISGGTLNISAEGDGLDSNGAIIMTGGDVFISGPTVGKNGAIDPGTTAAISGGRIIAAGAAEMAVNFGEGSSQGSILCTFDTDLPAGTKLVLLDSGGTELVSYVPVKSFRCAVLSAPGVEAGGTYVIKAGAEREYQVKAQ